MTSDGIEENSGSLRTATRRNFCVQKWAAGCRNPRFADLSICRSLCKKVCRENARLYFNSSAFSTANMFYERFNKAHLTVIMFSHKHWTEIKGRKLNAFLQRVTKILCHLIAFFLSRKPFANRAQSPYGLSLFPKICSSRALTPFLRDPFLPWPQKISCSIRNTQSSDHTLQIMPYLGV